jgi:hypothetical protein
MKIVAAEPEDGRTSTRELHLKRRRSRVPWVYLVYHRIDEAPVFSRGASSYRATLQAAEGETRSLHPQRQL